MAVQMLGEAPSVAAEPRRAGALLPAALVGQTAEGADWRKGAIVWPEAAPGWDTLRDCDPAHADHGLKTEVLPYGGVPMTIRTLTRTPFTTSLEVLRERAERQIRAVTSTAIARELWTGELAKATDNGAGPWSTPTGAPYVLANPRPAGSGTGGSGPWLNPHLDAATLLDPQPHPAAAVAAVEAAAAERLAGGPVYIHVPMEWVLELTQFNIRLDGDVLRTPLGSVVVADPGYPGTHGDGGDPCVYGTGPVQVWIDDPRVYDDPSLIVDYRDNSIAVWSERAALALFDPQTLVGCPVDTA